MTNDLTAQAHVTFISKQRIAPGGLPPPLIDGRQPPLRSISWSRRMRLFACIGSVTISFITVI
jgi:hypothetical protein